MKGVVTNNDIVVFKFYFPDSKWLPPLYKNLPAALKTNANSYDSSSIHYIEKPKNSLQEVLGQFAGRHVLIDLWASWCLPCRQEFVYNGAIDSITKEKNISRLYISIDNSSMGKSWKSAIAEYNLKGHHLLANEQLIKVIKTTFYSDRGVITIPRYIVVDKKGKIVNADAPRPSDPKLKAILESL